MAAKLKKGHVYNIVFAVVVGAAVIYMMYYLPHKNKPMSAPEVVVEETIKLEKPVENPVPVRKPWYDPRAWDWNPLNWFGGPK